MVLHSLRSCGFVPVQPLQALHAGKFAHIARYQHGLITQCRGGYQRTVEADGRACGLKLGANAGGTFAIKRQNLHRSQQSG